MAHLTMLMARWGGDQLVSIYRTRPDPRSYTTFRGNALAGSKAASGAPVYHQVVTPCSTNGSLSLSKRVCEPGFKIYPWGSWAWCKGMPGDKCVRCKCPEGGHITPDSCSGVRGDTGGGAE